MQVREIMSSEVKTVSPTDTVKKAAQIMRDIDCGSVPVVDGGKIVGILTDRDIVVTHIAEGKSPDSAVKECMTENVVTVRPETEAQAAADLMADNQVRRLPVVDHGKLVGILAIADLARKHIYVSESGKALSEISEPNKSANAVH